MKRPAEPDSSLSRRVADFGRRQNMPVQKRADPSFWLRGRLIDLNARHTSGQTLLCRHVAPGVDLVITLRNPNALDCQACSLAKQLRDVRDFTCDRCGAADTTPYALVLGPALVMANLCHTCLEKEVGPA